MSFNFVWPTFSDAFNADAREMLAQALNKGEKPPIIADRIEVKELNMGTLPPDLEILEIGDLSTDRFRGIFRLTYTGDAYIVLQTKVQANPLNVPRPSIDVLGEPSILFAAAPLIVPMTLRLSSLSLRAIVVLVVSRQKGITLVFKNDPLESVNVSSSFDGVESVAGYIQREIEGQLREAFRSDLPGVIHRLSQKWLSGEVKSAAEEVNEMAAKKGKEVKGFEKDAKIETRTSYIGSNGGKGPRGLTSQMDGNGDSVSIVGSDGDNYSTFDGSYPNSRTNSRSSSPTRSHQRRPIPLPVREDVLQSVPESIESYDPTYGLRPNTAPLQGGFAEYERLVRSSTAGRGLGDVLESSSSSSSNSEDEDGLFEAGFGGPDDSYEYDHRAQSVYSDDERSGGGRRNSAAWDRRFDNHNNNIDSFETVSAVGGGTITRPRIFHTQSQMRIRSTPASNSGSLSAHGSLSTATAGDGRRRRSGVDDSSTWARSTTSLGNRNGYERRSSAYSSIHQMNGDGRSEYFAGMAAGIHSRKESMTSNGFSPSHHHQYQYQQDRRVSSAGSSSQQRGLPSISYTSSNTSYRNGSTTSSRFPSNLNSTYSSPASSTLPSPKDSIPMKTFPPLRPDPIDLLSRSPSSVLDTSYDEDLGLPITLNPKENDTCAHLASLTHSNQTLSPFTRHYEHFTARSSPHVVSQNRLNVGGSSGFVSLTSRLGGGGSGLVGGGSSNETTLAPIKAKRKRIHRIGSAKIVPPIHLNGNNNYDTFSSNGGGSGGGSNSGSMGREENGYYNGRRISSNGSHHFSPGMGMGMGRSTAAPSEISDYFPSSPLPFRLRNLNGL